MPGIADLISPRKKVTFTIDTTVGGFDFTVGGFDFASEDAVITLDASINETHTGESEISNYPVEEGSNSSDNSRPQPMQLTILGVVTGTPMDITAIALPPSVKLARGKDAWSALDQWRRDGRRLRVTTSLNLYRGMVIKSLSVNRNSKNTDGVEMTIMLQEIVTVSAQTRKAPKQQRASKKQTKKQGQQSTTTATPADRTTVLQDLTGLKG